MKHGNVITLFFVCRLFDSFDSTTQKNVKKDEEKYKNEKMQRQQDLPFRKSQSAQNSPNGKSKYLVRSASLTTGVAAPRPSTSGAIANGNNQFSREFSQELLEAAVSNKPMQQQQAQPPKKPILRPSTSLNADQQIKQAMLAPSKPKHNST